MPMNPVQFQLHQGCGRRSSRIFAEPRGCASTRSSLPTGPATPFAKTAWGAVAHIRPARMRLVLVVKAEQARGQHVSRRRLGTRHAVDAALVGPPGDDKRGHSSVVGSGHVATHQNQWAPLTGVYPSSGGLQLVARAINSVSSVPSSACSRLSRVASWAMSVPK